ncbi:MAG: ImmA/IrrE family metallo-endopeptidase [Planctomycetales bacterium]|nr:ImmA/IrrE family metallo-endopeptidase [Planctomycetales bacterium]
MLAEIPAEQFQFALEAAAAEVLRDAQVESPPVDCFVLAERLGLTVARDGWGVGRGRFVRVAAGSRPRPTILLGDDPRPERLQWALAHEIGESVAWRVFRRLAADPRDAGDAAREGIANRLAGSLLLPREWLIDCGARCDWDLLELKTQFATASHELIARRMLEMPPPVIVTLFDQGAPVWRRSNALPRAPRLSDAEWAAWRTAHHSARPARAQNCECMEGIADVRAWPVHEPGWRREIIRTELQSWW